MKENPSKKRVGLNVWEKAVPQITVALGDFKKPCCPIQKWTGRVLRKGLA